MIDQPNNNIYFTCGVSGCGKSTIGISLSEKLGLPFYDGDDFHPKENIAKMASGNPLNDEDRQGWLEAINQMIISSNTGLVIACSALKANYRQILSNNVTNKIYWIFLDGPFDLIYSRLNARSEHFMPSSLLQSQYDILDIPSSALVCNIKEPVDQIVEKIIEQTNRINIDD